MGDPAVDEATGAAMAAFTLAQMTFWHFLRLGLLSKPDAEAMIQEAIKANQRGGPVNQKAVILLSGVLKNVQTHTEPSRN